jgi:hypothetical protein
MEKNLQQAEFLAYFQMLQEQTKSDYTRDQFLKLTTYIKFLDDCFMWNYRFEYLRIFLSFTNFTISGDEFVDEFMELRTSTILEFDQLLHELETSFEPLTKFVIDVKAFEFGDLINQTYEDCDVFVWGPLLQSIGETYRDLGEIDENEFHNRIQEATFTIQKQIYKDMK